MIQQFLKENSLDELLGAPGDFHPFPRGCERNEWEKLPEESKQILVRWGEKALNGYPQVTATQYLAYTRTGERRIFENPYFERRSLLFSAALAECIENQGRFLDAIIDGIWLICEETSWVVSAHNNASPDDLYPFEWKMLPDETNPSIDLFAAQTASVLSYVLYLTGHKLKQCCAQIEQRIVREIDRRILFPFLTRNDFWWMGYGSKTVNNWNPWILSNVIDTVLIVESDVNQRNRLIGKAMIILNHYLKIMPKDGGCDEGAGYFNVAGASLLDCLESLYCASNGKINFYQEPHIAAIGSYPEKVHISGEFYLNFADCDAKPLVDGERLYTFGKRTGNQRLMELGSMVFYQNANHGLQLLIRDTPQVNRVLFNLFQAPEFSTVTPEPAAFMRLPDLQVYSWYREGIYTAIKGGHNDESHNHNDVGNFVLYADGMPEIVDMGNKVYTAATFGPNRYLINNTRSMNHNVPMIGENEQCAGCEFSAQNVLADENGACMEIGGAYPAAAGVQSMVRKLNHKNEATVLTDTIELSKAESITWTFMLRNRPVLKCGEVRFGRMRMMFSESLSASVEEMPVDDQRMQRSFPGSLWRLALKSKKDCKHEYSFEIQRA